MKPYVLTAILDYTDPETLELDTIDDLVWAFCVRENTSNEKIVKIVQEYFHNEDVDDLWNGNEYYLSAPKENMGDLWVFMIFDKLGNPIQVN